MGGQRCIVHGSIHFPKVEFSGRLGLEAAGRIRKALERAKERVFRPEQTNALLKGKLETDGVSCRVEPAYLSANVLLGAGMLYTRTTTASLVWMVLNSIILMSDKGNYVTNSEPAYFSVAVRSPCNGTYTFGKSSLLAALHSTAGRADHHRMLRDLAGGMGARVGIQEIIVGMPCREVLALAGEEFGYAISGRVPLGELIILNGWGSTGDVCRLEVQAEAMKAKEEIEVSRLEAEMKTALGRLRNLEKRGAAE